MVLYVKIISDGKFAVKMKNEHIRLKLSKENFCLVFAYIFPPIKRKKETKKSSLQ